MTAFRIKLCGLNEKDTSSLKSMLSLASEQLTHNWTIVESVQAELYIYSLDSTEGQIAWGQHNQQAVTALLSSTDSPSESFDLILKKPLRTKNFSLALNGIENKISDENVGKVPPKHNIKKKPSSSPGLFSALARVFGRGSGLAKPTLQQSLPEQNQDGSDTILDTKELKKWFKGLQSKDVQEQISDILGNIISLNRTIVPTQKRFNLLEIYIHPVEALLHNLIIKETKAVSKSHLDYIKIVHSINLVLEELSIGYKIIINDYYQQAKHPNSNAGCLIAINRVAENIALSIIYAYSHYLAVPKNSLNTLHQLYLYNEYYQTLDKIPSFKKTTCEHSFSHIYNALILTGIANPYCLAKHEAKSIYNLMEKFADNITLIQLSEEHIHADKNPAVAGHFCIDTTSNKMPLSLLEEPERIRSLPQSRLLNTQQILEGIETIFKDGIKSVGPNSESADIHLLKKVVPQFNSTYTRRFQRDIAEQSSKLDIALGLAAIHTCITTASLSQTSKWTIHNQGIGGMMISSASFDAYHLTIGESIGIFKDQAEPGLAIIRWMRTNKAGVTQLGLDVQNTNVKAINLSPENKNDIFIGLLLPAASGSKLGSTILVERSTYLPLQKINVTEGNLTYKISVDTPINNAFHDEMFSFTISE